MWTIGSKEKSFEELSILYRRKADGVSDITMSMIVGDFNETEYARFVGI